MRLLDLDPQWIDREWEDRKKIGLEFKCIHCEERLKIFFSNPLDGGTPKGADPRWQVTHGWEFRDLSLYPSIDWMGHMHVSVDHGEVRKA